MSFSMNAKLPRNGRYRPLQTLPLGRAEHRILPNALIRGRELQRANRPSHAETARMGADVSGTSHPANLTNLTFFMDERSRAIVGYALT